MFNITKIVFLTLKTKNLRAIKQNNFLFTIKALYLQRY